MQASATSAKPHGHEGQTRKKFFEKDPWSALQTHLQGVDWATLAIMPEKCRHRAALLSRLSHLKIAQPAREGKPRALPGRKRNAVFVAKGWTAPSVGDGRYRPRVRRLSSPGSPPAPRYRTETNRGSAQGCPIGSSRMVPQHSRPRSRGTASGPTAMPSAATDSPGPPPARIATAAPSAYT